MEKRCFFRLTFKQKATALKNTQGSTNWAHGDERARNVHAKRLLRAGKSIETLLGSTPMLFKILSYFCA